MADDTTAEVAKRILLIEIADCLERAFANNGKGSGRIVEYIDALIAAVRAEKEPETSLAAMIEQELDASEPQPQGGQHVGPMASHWQIAPSTRKAIRWMLREWKARQGQPTS